MIYDCLVQIWDGGMGHGSQVPGAWSSGSVLGFNSVPGPRCQVPGSGYQVSGIRAIFILHTRCAGFQSVSQAFRQVPGTRCRVPATWRLAPDTRYRINAEGRTPSTEDRVWPPENAHIGSASCILHTPCAGFSKAGARYRVPGIGYRLSGTWDLVPGTGAGPTPRAEHRAPKTEPGHRKTRTSGMHPASIS